MEFPQKTFKHELDYIYENDGNEKIIDVKPYYSVPFSKNLHSKLEIINQNLQKNARNEKKNYNARLNTLTEKIQHITTEQAETHTTKSVTQMITHFRFLQRLKSFTLWTLVVFIIALILWLLILFLRF